jgi:hypothetical protein
MSVRQIEIDKIITYLKSITAIHNITWDRIYFWLPISDEQVWTYITINILWEQQSFLNKWTLLEFRFIGHNTNATFNSLLILKNLVSNEFLSNKSLSSFYVYNCYEDWWLNNWYDEKNRRVVIQDYRFYFLN